MENQSSETAREALFAIGDSRRAAADRLVTPWWYHPALGLLAAGFVLIYALGNPVVMVAGVVLYFAGLGVLVGSYVKKTGVWIGGLSAGKASRWAWCLVGMFVVCLLGGVAAARVAAVDWVAWLAAVVLFAGVNILGRRFDTAVRAQLRDVA
ncbi:hypothetical protein AAGW05_10900 [Arthrobacter sp. LAPM80]|uniref:hypothetical protein n=1 Tax=Arthrobacter sp. LAPM80 TaxID=3141788 RepID=UPI00398A80AD